MKNSIFNVVVDTNVIISSLISKHLDSATVKIMELFLIAK